MAKKTTTTELDGEIIDAAARLRAGRRVVTDHVPVETPPPPSLTTLLPDYVSVRTYWCETSPKQAATVWLCFNRDRDLKDCPDKRLRALTAEQLRGHAAQEIAPPMAAYVRMPSGRHVVLAGKAPEYQLDAHGIYRPVAAFPVMKAGSLDEDPCPCNFELSVEMLMRLEQLEEGATEAEVTTRYAPFSPHIFAQTRAERTEVRACLYKLPSSGSAVMWVMDERGHLWACGLVRGAALRRVEQPEIDRVREWNKRSSAERGII
jgi:hypothetical protein